jgi:hypothetical protein
MKSGNDSANLNFVDQHMDTYGISMFTILVDVLLVSELPHNVEHDCHPE